MKNLILILGLYLSVTITAQEKSNYSFSLEDAKQFALENNQSVKNSKLDIEAAKKKILETTAIGLPQINASYNFQYIPGEIPSIQFDPNMPPIELGVAQSATYDITVSQLIFNGEYIVGLQASKTFLELSKNAYEKSISDLKENVSSGYYTVLTLKKNKDILDSTIVNLEKIYFETKAYVETGFIEETELEQLEITLNTVKNSLKMVERQVEISYKLLKILLGIGLDETIELTQSIEDFLLIIDKENILNNQFSLNNNIEYKILETQERVSELSLKREKSTFLPTISGFYLYQDKTNKADFDITFNNIIGISATMPIFSSGQKIAKVSQAKIDLEKTKNLKAQVSESILMSIDQTRYDFSSAYEKYQTERANTILTKKIYDKTALKYKNGMASGMDLTQANNQFLESNNKYIMATLDLLIAKVKLEKALNVL